MKLNFMPNKIQQDVVMTMAKDKNLSPEEAILQSVTDENFKKLTDYKVISVAIPMWRHFENIPKFTKMKCPIVEIPFTNEQISLISKLRRKEKFDSETAVTAFIMIELGEMGYHL